MILLYLIFLAVATFVLVIGYNKEVDRLTNRIDDLIDELAFAGKNYVDKTNGLRDEIRVLKKDNDKLFKENIDYRVKLQELQTVHAKYLKRKLRKS